MPQINLSDFPRFFQIFETGERLVQVPEPVPLSPSASLVTLVLLALTGLRCSR